MLTKDFSRLGRNSSLTGLYINFTFPKYSVRYIAINDHFDTIDTNSNDNDVADIKNWVNEFFSKNTSRTVLCMEGRGAMQIAKLLQAEKVLNPTSYKRREGNPQAPKPPTTLRSGKTISYSSTTAAIREAVRHTLSGRLCWINWSGCT